MKKIPRFMQEWLVRIVRRSTVRDLGLRRPAALTNSSLSRWIEEIGNKLDALYAVSDGNEVAFRSAASSADRMLTTIERELDAIDQSISTIMRATRVASGRHLVDLTHMVGSLHGVHYDPSMNGYTLKPTTSASWTVGADGRALCNVSLSRHIGELVSAGDGTRLVVGHPDEAEEWVTASTAPIIAGEVGHWVPSIHELGEVLQFDMDFLQPVAANELVVDSTGPVRVLQIGWQHGVPVQNQNPNSAPNKMTFANGSIVTDMLLKPAVRLNVNQPCWASSLMPVQAAPSHIARRTWLVRVRMRSTIHLTGIIQAHFTGTASQRVTSSVRFELRPSLVAETFWLEVDDVLEGSTLSVLVRPDVQPESGYLFVYSIEVFPQMQFMNLPGQPLSTSHRIRFDSSTTYPFLDSRLIRFSVVLENPSGTVGTDGRTVYRTGIRTLDLRRSASPPLGAIEFAPVESSDTVRAASIFIRGQNMENSSMVITGEDGGESLELPLESTGINSHVLISATDEVVGTTIPAGTAVLRVTPQKVEERFIGTENRRLTLRVTPYLDRSSIRRIHNVVGGYDPNSPITDVNYWSLVLSRTDGNRIAWKTSDQLEWREAPASEPGWYQGRVVYQGTGRRDYEVVWQPRALSRDRNRVLIFLVKAYGSEQPVVQVSDLNSTAVYETRLLRDPAHGQADPNSFHGYLLVFLPTHEQSEQVGSLRILCSIQLPSSSTAAQGLLQSSRFLVNQTVGIVPVIPGVVPVTVSGRWRGYEIVPGTLSTSGEKSHILVENQRVLEASSERIAQYSQWAADNQIQYQLSASRKAFMTQYYPIVTNQDSGVLLSLKRAKPYSIQDTGSNTVITGVELSDVPRDDFLVIPAFGIIEPNFDLGKDEFLVADYTFHGQREALSSRLSSASAPLAAVNRTDYIRGMAPRLRPADINPNSPDYYPVLEYYQHGRTLVFGQDISALEEGDGLVVRYLELPVRLRIRLILRKTHDGRVPVLKYAALGVETEQTESLEAGTS